MKATPEEAKSPGPDAGGSPVKPSPARGVLERVREFAIRLLQPRRLEEPVATADERADETADNRPDDTAGLSVVELLAGGHVPEAVVEHLRSENDRARVAQEAMLRAIADGEDVRSRLTEQKEQAVKFANEALLKAMLPVLDNLEICLQHSEPESRSPLGEAIEMTLRQWYAVFEKAGAVKIDAARGGEFEPSLHEVVMDEPDAAVPKGGIARIVQTGLRFHDRVLRPTRVSLSTGAPATVPREEARRLDQVTPEGAAAQGGGEAFAEAPAGPAARLTTPTAAERSVRASSKGRKKAKARPKPRAKPKAKRKPKPKPKAARGHQQSTRSGAGRK